MTPAFPADFDGQFLVSSDPLPPDPLAGGPHAGRDVPLPSLFLRAWPGLRAAHVRDAAGRTIGVLLGRPVDHRAGRIVRDELILPEAVPEGRALDAFIERRLLGLSGSWILILDIPGARRLYLDASGTLSAVFDANARLAGATAPLLLGPEAAAARFDEALFAHLDILGEGWFPAGLTAHEGVERVIVDHFLDLDAMSQHRHWPDGPIARADDPEEAASRVLAAARATIDALRAAGPTAQCLTAGNETRFLLAACRDIARDIDFVTVDAPEAALDRIRTAEIAARFGLSRRLLPHVRASEEAAADWLARAGFAVGGTNMWNHPTVRPLAKLECLIGGAAGEVGRGFFWRPGDRADMVMDEPALTPRFGMPAHPKVRAAVAKWLEGAAKAAGGDALLVLDLAYLELRMGAWAGAQSYAAAWSQDIHPLSSRESFAAMLSLPPDWRRGNRLILDGIRMAWPELLELPFNRYGDWRDQARVLGRAARNPRLILKKLRKRFG